MKLRKLLHPFYYELLRFVFSKDNKAVTRIRYGNRGRVFLLQAADYGNIGDIAITLAQTQRLRSLFPDKELVVMYASSEYDDLKSLIRCLKDGDLIAFVGGGSIGDVYYYYEIYRQLVVTMSRHIPIVVFPQSVKFRKLSNFRRAASIYSGKRELLFAAREEYSYRQLATFANRRILVPDIALTMDYYNSALRSGAGLCLRNDYERLLTDREQKYVEECVRFRFDSVSDFDTHCGIDNLPPDCQRALFKETVDTISSKELLVTDRLHGMIFGFITGTPTIALSNNNQKILGSYKWIESCPYVKYLEDVRELPAAIDELSHAGATYEDFRLCRDKILAVYDDFDNRIREFVKKPRD